MLIPYSANPHHLLLPKPQTLEPVHQRNSTQALEPTVLQSRYSQNARVPAMPFSLTRDRT
ncbi:hypothetical protein [Scytonema sp. NUACC26]|uniref:hypothetical protein n=1 Tax=Scytonema sp. NUACC26 TaxID=3140176 RepID=UPI0038B3EEC9